MNEDDNYFMVEAIKEASKSGARGDWPIGCVIVIDGEIVSRGSNKVYSESNKTLHAEIDAMSKISNILSERGSEATIYITYEPCPMCLGAITLNHFKRVVCGTDVDKSGALDMIAHLPLRFSGDKYKFVLDKNFMEKECREVFIIGDPVQKLDL